MAWGGNHALRKRRQVLEVYGNICWLCKQPIPGLPRADHVLPRSKGGTDDIENLRPAHLRCNISRGNRVPKMKAQLKTSTDW